MSHNLNSTMLLGRATSDPRVRQTAKSSVASFRIAVNHSFKRGDEWVEKPMFIECEGYGKLAEAIESKISKGVETLVKGRLELDEWEKDGQKHSKHKVVVQEISVNGTNGKGAKTAQDEQKEEELEGDFPF